LQKETIVVKGEILYGEKGGGERDQSRKRKRWLGKSYSKYAKKGNGGTESDRLRTGQDQVFSGEGGSKPPYWSVTCKRKRPAFFGQFSRVYKKILFAGRGGVGKDTGSGGRLYRTCRGCQKGEGNMKGPAGQEQSTLMANKEQHPKRSFLRKGKHLNGPWRIWRW